jgi:hypothetical protein
MFVQRDENAAIIGVFANLQPGVAEEWVDGAQLTPMVPSRDQVEAQRLHAYADAVTGSDRFFAEVSRLTATNGPSDEIAAAQLAGVNRYAEIQAQFPWPAK